MTRLAPISSKKLIRLLEHLGFTQVRQQGSHCFFFHEASRLSTVVPDHGSEDISRGLLRRILRDINISAEEFDRLRNE